MPKAADFTYQPHKRVFPFWSILVLLLFIEQVNRIPCIGVWQPMFTPLRVEADGVMHFLKSQAVGGPCEPSDSMLRGWAVMPVCMPQGAEMTAVCSAPRRLVYKSVPLAFQWEQMSFWRKVPPDPFIPFMIWADSQPNPSGLQLTHFYSGLRTASSQAGRTRALFSGEGKAVLVSCDISNIS